MSPNLSSLPDATRAALCDLPPSAKLVYLVLQEQGESTQQQLVAETLLSARTIRHALGDLENAGVVDSRHSFVDARQKLYSSVRLDMDSSQVVPAPLSE
ncbi:MAG: hypothetical protein ABEJ05_02430 [Haloglomus sp.]